MNKRTGVVAVVVAALLVPVLAVPALAHGLLAAVASGALALRRRS